MKSLFLFCFTLIFSFSSTYAQSNLKLNIINADTKEPLKGASVKIIALNKTAVADSLGSVLFKEIVEGSYAIVISYVGFAEKEITITIPQTPNTIHEVFLEEIEEEQEDVVVTATRISRTISNTPTRTEVISGEELTEKGNMKPGDIRMMLNESTGIQTQQTSATSFNAGIRIQGLEGRYTQMLRDGYPMYSGFSGSLSLLQIAPLDLKQVEVIKGASSTLFGGGAIAGIVNLVSKTPTKERRLDFLSNATSSIYFPSYEIMMDELRDYRFYAEDMLHPNQTAIDYIWMKFSENFINETEFETMQHVSEIQKALNHRPFNPNSESHLKFKDNLKQKINAIVAKYPEMKF